MEPDKYLRKHHLMTYVKDLTCLVIENRNSKTLPKEDPITLMEKYLHKVVTGVHVYGRKYSFIVSTPYNRASFVRLVWQCYFKGLSVPEEMFLSCEEIYQLLQLLCVDFNQKFTDYAARLVSSYESIKCDKITFSKFMYMFQVLFYYDDFISDCEQIFNVQKLLDDRSSSDQQKGVVVLPRLDVGAFSPSLPIDKYVSGCSAEPAVLTWMEVTDLIKKLCSNTEVMKNPEKVCPSECAISSVLDICHTESAKEHNMFDCFLRKFCSCDMVNAEIGILPAKESFIQTAPPHLGSPFRFTS